VNDIYTLMCKDSPVQKEWKPKCDANVVLNSPFGNLGLGGI
jgi:hypothetical protein